MCVSSVSEEVRVLVRGSLRGLSTTGSPFILIVSRIKMETTAVRVSARLTVMAFTRQAIELP